ncbi:MAG: hypothetical protein ABJM29_16115 [Rhizobiaceae bacterium]
MSEQSKRPKPLLTVRPGDYLHLRGWPARTFYKVVVNASGIKLKRARFFESWGAVLGANMSHRLENETQILIFGLGFIVRGDAGGESCTLTEMT